MTRRQKLRRAYNALRRVHTAAQAVMKATNDYSKDVDGLFGEDCDNPTNTSRSEEAKVARECFYAQVSYAEGPMPTFEEWLAVMEAN